jgi:hypothetical protein
VGYYTNVTGELYFSPPLNKDQFRAIRDIASDSIYSSEIDPWSLGVDTSMKAYGLVDCIRDIVTLAATFGVTVTGALECVGEEMPDIWRVSVKDGVVTREEAKIIWPDGSEFDA